MIKELAAEQLKKYALQGFSLVSGKYIETVNVEAKDPADAIRKAQELKPGLRFKSAYELKASPGNADITRELQKVFSPDEIKDMSIERFTDIVSDARQRKISTQAFEKEIAQKGFRPATFAYEALMRMFQMAAYARLHATNMTSHETRTETIGDGTSPEGEPLDVFIRMVRNWSTTELQKALEPRSGFLTSERLIIEKEAKRRHMATASFGEDVCANCGDNKGYARMVGTPCVACNKNFYKKEMAAIPSGLKQWVEDYKKARHSGNVKLATQIKKNIDHHIEKLKLNKEDVYGPDPEIPNTPHGKKIH